MHNEKIILSNLNQELNKVVSELQNAFLEIQQPRTEFTLRHFVVGQHDTIEQQYAQCVLEMQIKYDNIRRALLSKKRIEIEIKELESKNTEIDLIDAEIKKIDLEAQDRAIVGAWREFQVLYKIWNEFPKKYTRQELDLAQPEYWQKRIARQANQDLIAMGRIQVGNQESLNQIGLSSTPELNHIRQIEKKYLENGDCKILIAVPTRTKAEKLPVIENIIIPSGIQVKYYNVFGKSVHEAYNDAVMTAIKDNADFILTVEDDTYPPHDAIIRLLKLFNDLGPNSVVGAWYPKKQIPREGTPIIIKDGKRQALMDDGNIHEVYTIPMGTTLFPIAVFLKTVFPYFATTEHLTQDSFFSQKARDAGYKLFVDTNIKCRHFDINSNIFYE